MSATTAPAGAATAMTPARGSLILVPNTLDLGAPQAPPIEAVLPAGVLQQAAHLAHWVAEDAKTTRAFLKRVGAVVPLARSLQEIHIRELPRPAKGSRAASAHAPSRQGDFCIQEKLSMAQISSRTTLAGVQKRLDVRTA